MILPASVPPTNENSEAFRCVRQDVPVRTPLNAVSHA